MAPENNRFLYVGAVISFISAALPIGHRLYSMGIMHTDLQLVKFSGILLALECSGEFSLHLGNTYSGYRS
jgi:hypothetical protein